MTPAASAPTQSPPAETAHGSRNPWWWVPSLYFSQGIPYVIVNGKLGMQTNCVSDCLRDLTLRTLDMLLDANAIGDLYHIKYELDRIGFGKFRLARIPRDFPVTSSAVFEPGPMRRLYEEGVRFGREGNWEREIPEVDLRPWL